MFGVILEILNLHVMSCLFCFLQSLDRLDVSKVHIDY